MELRRVRPTSQNRKSGKRFFVHQGGLLGERVPRNPRWQDSRQPVPHFRAPPRGRLPTGGASHFTPARFAISSRAARSDHPPLLWVLRISTSTAPSNFGSDRPASD